MTTLPLPTTEKTASFRVITKIAGVELVVFVRQDLRRAIDNLMEAGVNTLAFNEGFDTFLSPDLKKYNRHIALICLLRDLSSVDSTYVTVNLGNWNNSSSVVAAHTGKTQPILVEAV